MDNPKDLLQFIPALPLLGALINLTFGRRFSRGTVHAVAIGAVLASFAVTLAVIFKGVLPARESEGLKDVLFTWIQVGALDIELAFRMDTLTALMCFVITGIGLLIHIYSTGYMAEEPRYAAYFGYLNLFTGAMLILVLGNNLPVMFIGWEGVGLCSYLLIGFWFTNPAYADAGRKAFVVNRIGDFGFLLGMFVLFMATGTLDFDSLNETSKLAPLGERATALPFDPKLGTIAAILLFVGACGKSAQIPLYVWLPDAMAGPTPVSALIHAATMVTAGVYMVARMSFLFASNTMAMLVVATVGAFTALFAAYMAFAQTDLKKVLAYSTVSQLGFMFVGVGTGAWVAGIFHLFTHAFFKAGLFLGAGSVMHAMSGSGDIMKMGGLKKKLPLTHISFAIYCFAIAGLPFMSGFFSKDEILAGAYFAHIKGWPVWYGKFLWAILTIAAFGTAFYMYRLYYLVFGGECRADEETKSHIHESPYSMTLPLLVLAFGAALFGFVGLPHLSFLHGLNGIEAWLSPALAPASVFSVGNVSAHGDGNVIMLMVMATIFAVVAWYLARMLYKTGPSIFADRITSGGIPRALYLGSLHKLWVDELYESTIIRCFRWLCRMFFVAIDRFLIDGLFVTGSAVLVEVCGRMIRWFQNGQVQRYLVAVLVGGALLLVYATQAKIDFDYTAEGTQVDFIADVGAGPGPSEGKVRWYFDDDPFPDAEKVEATWNFPKAGEYKVSLEFEDGVFGDVKRITKTVVVGKEGER
jgi:NADH-quinone oxidoreductase subunit L